MRPRLLEVAASAVGLLVLLLALWPPEYVYWTALADVIGGALTPWVVLLVAALAGAAIAVAVDVELASLAIGGVVAYLVAMGLIEARMTPESPVHFVFYGALLGAILVGATAVRIDRDVLGWLP